jgi:hypothetical protein
MSRIIHRLASGVFFLITALLLSQLAAPQAFAGSSSATVVRSWGVTGRVNSLLVVGNKVFVGGTFSAVTDPSGNTFPITNLAVYLPASNTFDTSWHPQPNDNVAALAASADGSKLYIGGDFSSVNGAKASRLASLSVATGATTSGWKPSASATVNALGVSGGMVYVGGKFAQLNDPAGVARIPYLARVSEATGRIDRNWKPTPDAQVRAVAFSTSGSQVFVGGDFTVIAGVSTQPHLVSLTTTNGTLAPGFKAAPYNQGSRPEVFGLAVDGSNLLIAAGGGGGSCAAERATNGALTWSYHANGDVQSVSVANGTVWCGGHFDGPTSFAGLSRKKLAAVNEADGAILAYDPVIDSALGLWSTAASGNGVYVGGDFTHIDFKDQPHFAFVMPSSAAVAPLPPPNLAVRSGDHQARLFWDVPFSDGGSSLKNYQVFRGVNGGSMTQVASTGSLSYVNNGLTNGTTYQFAVKATNALGASALSASQTVTPQPGQPQVPTPPRALTAINTGGHAVLEWDRPADDGGSALTHYLVMRGGSSGSETSLATIGPSSTSFTDNTSSPGNTYYYRVVAQNAVGNSPPSNEYSVQVTQTPPDAPVLSATVTSKGVSLSWTTPGSGGSPITQYTVVRDSLQIAHLPFGTNTYLDTSVSRGHGVTYSYQVRATNAIGNGPLSNAVNVTP